MELGVLLDADSSAPEELVALAGAADRAGATIALLRAGRRADAWTVAAWVAGRTERIRVGVLPEVPREGHEDPLTPLPSVVEKATASLAMLAPHRTIPDGVAWSMVERGGDVPLSDQGGAAVPIVSVQSLADIDALASVVADHQGEHPPEARRSARSALVIAQRSAGIDYDGIPASLAARAIEPGDPDHGRFASTYLRGGAPGLVLRPRTVEEVSAAIAFARDHRHLPLGIRSGGHGISGRSTNQGGLVISVGDMDELDVIDHRRRLVRVGPGRTWKRVAHALRPYGWALGSGDYGGVGVGGLATAGGIGLLSRKHGLTIDHLRAVELVLADGTPVRASDTENPDLFWAVRGAGANFGIATAFEFEVSEVGEVGWAQLVLVTDDIETSIRRYGEIAREAPRDTTVFFVTGNRRGGQWGVSLYGVVDDPDPEVVVERLSPFLALGEPLRRPEVVMTPYTGVMDNAADVGPEGQRGAGEPVSRSALLPDVTPEFARAAAELLSADLVYFFELRAMGGATADVAPQAMAFSHRSAQFQLAAMSARDEVLSGWWRRMSPHFEGTYLSFETDRNADRLTEAFPPPVLQRLRELKSRYDPTNLFRDNFNILPAAADTEKRGAV